MIKNVLFPNAAFDAVIFDCDGVLVDSEVVGLDEATTFLQSHGLPWDKAGLVERFSGLRDDQFFAQLTAAYKSVNGHAPSDDFFDRLYDTRRLSTTPILAVEGARETLKAIPIATAIASSSRTDRLEKKLKQTQLWDLVAPHVYSADAVERGKPDPQIYLHAAKALNADPARCLVLEDSVQGVISGIKAGMTVWGFTGGGHSYEGHSARLRDVGASWVAQNFAAFDQQFSTQP